MKTMNATKSWNERELFNYLTGRETDFFLRTGVLGALKRSDGSEYLVASGIKHDLQALQHRFFEHGIQMEVASGYRSFEQQANIWNEKVEGKRVLLDCDEVTALDVKHMQAEEILEKILLFSSIPGTSRHHWGTDVDFFDLNYYQKHSKKLLLINREYEAGGPSGPMIKKFCEWEENKAQNDTLPFFRPFLNDRQDKVARRAGPQREEWHISHRKLSSFCERNYTLDLFKLNLQTGQFHLSDLIAKDPEFYFRRFFLVS
jgi:hypothetical protein